MAQRSGRGRPGCSLLLLCSLIACARNERGNPLPLPPERMLPGHGGRFASRTRARALCRQTGEEGPEGGSGSGRGRGDGGSLRLFSWQASGHLASKSAASGSGSPMCGWTRRKHRGLGLLFTLWTAQDRA
ncbi:hypothetical protein DFH11DRAFT_1627449, partial [Phellopilus nigrolimitatus]